MPNGTRLTKDQQRALHAYGHVQPLWEAYTTTARGESDDTAKKSAKEACEKYETAVRSLGANILRSGLSAAFAELMRRKDDTAALRCHLARSQIPGLTECGADDLFQTVNRLDVTAYMLATRETLQVVMWLKRAAEALFDVDGPDTQGAVGGSGNQGGGPAHARMP